MQEASLLNFNKTISSVIRLLEAGKNEEARQIFNQSAWPLYSPVILDIPFRPLHFFFFALDQLLNDPAVNITGQVTKEDIIGSYYSDYRQDLQEAARLEESRQ